MIMSITSIFAQQKFEQLISEIDKGNFSNSEKAIDSLLISSELSFEEKSYLRFEKERMNRIRLDFQKSKQDIINFSKEFLPDVNDEMILNWEKDGSLEFMIIDGEKKYFNRSHTNLFRINKELRKIKESKLGTLKDSLDFYLEKNIPNILDKLKNKESINPQKIKFTYTVSVKPNMVPNNEIIRAWLPFPVEYNSRQSEVRLISVNNDQYVLSGKNQKHSSIYLEKAAKENEPTIFEYSVEYSAKPLKYFVDAKEIIGYNKESDLYKTYVKESAPHILFSEEIKLLSNEIIGEEENPYIIAKKIFTWINDNIPCAGAREYSTLRNISDYCIDRMHGDCGIKTLLFITLCRYNGIPARWQSGWMLHPGNVNLHDWGEIYFEGIGWIPVDQSFGIIDSEIEDAKYFFFGGTDQFHMIVNEDYSDQFYPQKNYERSETVDFQRGELEWRGGNLYFDKWNYNMKVEYLN